MDLRVAQREQPVDGRIVMRQTWTDLLFLHWEVDPEIIQARLPDGLSVDYHEGKTYLGLVPFLMDKVRPVGTPALPWISRFPEMNVRAYVLGPDGRPGVWFFSLDAARWPAVILARSLFHLPYVWSKMRYQRTTETVDYFCKRRSSGDIAKFRYDGTGVPVESSPGSLEFFLLERYLLFSHDPRRDQLFCGQVHHRPYLYTQADVEGMDDRPLGWNGFAGIGKCVSQLFSPGVDVNIYPLKRL